MPINPYKLEIKTKLLNERNKDIYNRYQKLGMSMDDIGAMYNISRERVRQILKIEKDKRSLKNRIRA